MGLAGVLGAAEHTAVVLHALEGEGGGMGGGGEGTTISADGTTTGLALSCCLLQPCCGCCPEPGASNNN